ncbi:MAG: T9SS type A sorting domain-containing protein [Mariniphaga sp.]|nr:T9SS type A sorting domain-containing protein [Mariniphaga sp.]
MLDIIFETGQTIFSKKYNRSNNQNLVQLDLSAYPAGVYFIKAASSKNVKVGKFILNPK